MAKFTVKNTTILHNETSYGVGAEIELTAPEAVKLADYITSIATAKIASTPNNDAGSNPTIAKSTDLTVTTPTTKTAKSNKKMDKPVTTADSPAGSTVDEIATAADATIPTDEVTTDSTQQEAQNDTTSV